MPDSPILLAFGFGNLAILGWLVAAGAPLIIHLWNRRKYRETPWAAIDFLLAAMRKNARRVRLEQWLLLAVRTLLVMLLVFALAEPFLQRAGVVIMEGERTHRVIVLDSSFSMGYRPSDKRIFERAKELAIQIVKDSPQGDGFSLVLLSDPPLVVVGSPAFEPANFIDEIEALRLTHGGANLPAAMEQVQDILQRAEKEHPRVRQHEVYFLSDLQRRTWMPAQQKSDVADVFLTATSRVSQLAAMVVVDLGQDSADNIAVTELRATEPLSTVTRDVVVEAEVENLGRQAHLHQLVEFYVDGHRAGEEHLRLEPGGSETVSFSYRFDSGGDHGLEVRCGGDLLDVDNHRWLSLPVKDSIRVLCINGHAAGGTFNNATDFLVVALAPHESSEQSLVRPEVYPESALLELSLENYDVVFLCNVGQFTASEAQVLESYLKKGGGLVFFLGDQVRADSYNRQLFGEGPDAVRVLPARLGEVVDELPQGLDPLEYAHPLVSPFRGKEQAGLLTTLIYRYIQLQIPEGSEARTALAFTNGDPAIVEEAIHRGRSIVVATSADDSWTPMPLWHSYLPIVQELLAWSVSGQTHQRNLLVGEPLGGSLPMAASDVPLKLTPPGEPERSLRVQSDQRGMHWSFAETANSGIYTTEVGAPISRQEQFAVNVDPQESQLGKIAAAELRNTVWPKVDFQLLTTWQDLEERPVTGPGQRGFLHRWLLYAVLGLLFFETFLAWYIGNHRV
jgi:hypothetical protein